MRAMSEHTHSTALHQRAKVGDVEGVAALVEGGCSLDLQDKVGNTALHEVSYHGFSQCVKLLVKAGADVHLRNKAGNTPLHLACQNDHSKTARLLLMEGSSPDTKNNMGDTCLHVAARYNNLRLVKILINSLCSVNDTNQAGDTALRVAATLNHKKTVKLLLKFGADGKITNKHGQTGLHTATDDNHKGKTTLLVRPLQVQGFQRRKTVWKRKQRRGDQSRPPPATKETRFVVEETLSKLRVDQTTMEPRQQQKQKSYHNTPVTIGSPHSHCNNRRLRTQKAASGCYCEPVLMKLEKQVKATQDEMRLHILNVQEELSIRLMKMDRRNRHQIQVLDMLSQERASAERKDLILRMEQRADKSKEEVLLTQHAAVKHAFNQWSTCLNIMDVHMADQSRYYKLLRAPTVEPSVSDVELESFPLLSVLSEDSSTSTYVNIRPSKPPRCVNHTANRTFFEKKVDRSPDDYENTALYPWRRKHTLLSRSGSAESCWQNYPSCSSIQQCSERFSSSSSSDLFSLSKDKQQREAMSEGRYRHHLSTDTSAFFTDHPTEATLIQERNIGRAVEVTQHFFEIVSKQLERWCQRKILEVEQQTELRVEQERTELLQRICLLEEEIQQLKTSEKTEKKIFFD